MYDNPTIQVANKRSGSGTWSNGKSDHPQRSMYKYLTTRQVKRIELLIVIKSDIHLR